MSTRFFYAHPVRHSRSQSLYRATHAFAVTRSYNIVKTRGTAYIFVGCALYFIAFRTKNQLSASRSKSA